MTPSSELSTILSPLISRYQPKSVLIVGEIAHRSYENQQDTRTQVLTTPFSLEQLSNLKPINLAIISDVIESMSKPQAIEWLSMVRNRHAQQLIIIVDSTRAAQQGWQLADYLALGMNNIDSHQQYQFFGYAIESYRPKRDWLNSRFWANPENYDKYRW